MMSDGVERAGDGEVHHPRFCADFLGVRRREFAEGSAAARGPEAGPAARDRCVARLITYLRLHYCKQCVSLYVRSLLPFVLSCLLPTYLPDARLSRLVVHLAVIYWREPFRRAQSSPRPPLKSSAVSQMYFKTTRRRVLSSSPPRVCLCARSPFSLRSPG